MYRASYEPHSLDYILAKLAGERYSAANPVTYSTSDILSARRVLKRLMEDTSRNEVSSIRQVVAENNEA
jgi:hypothetical protein